MLIYKNIFLQNMPLSPHLQIHTLTLNMFCSILNRICAIFLYFIFLLFIPIPILLLTSPSWLISTIGFMYSQNIINYLTIILIFFFWFALFYHAIAVIRHMLWDIGIHRIEKNKLFASDILLLTLSLTLTVCMGFIIYY